MRIVGFIWATNNMLTHPMPDPIAIALGPIAVHWYGLMYGVAFLQFLLLGKLRVKQPHINAQGWVEDDVSDMMFYGLWGVIIGGRLGEVIFYQFDYFLQHPLDILKIWQGGMSFHGGFLGVVIAMYFWARKSKKALGDVYDFIAPLVPLGYAAGRIGNFINAELPGRLASADLPWAMHWPNISHPVHPSPIYQALVDGVLVFVILWFLARTQKPRWVLGASFSLLYGCARFFTEYFRTPDYEVSFLGATISSGQLLSLPMIAVGLGVIVWVYARHNISSFSKP
jgi:phosphatidylglycerol---prolipoprotein diacylglyceryl transferase